MTTLYKTYAWYVRTDQCRGPYTQYANLTDGYTVDRSNPPESRALPSGSLILHPTAQSIQDRGDGVSGIEAFNGFTKNPYNCPDVGYVPVSFYTMATTFPNIATLYYPPTNWQLDARLKIKDLALNLGQSMFEYRETASMFKKAASRVWDAYRCVRRLKVKRCIKQVDRKIDLRDVASSHLTMQFGVVPLLSDVYNATLRLNSVLAKPIYRRVVVTKSSTDGYETPGTHSGSLVVKGRMSERAVLYVKLEPAAYDWTPGNPLEIAWELVPFSFVVDWLIPVGDYLSSLDALKGVSGVTGTLTRKTIRTVRDTRCSSSYNNDPYYARTINERVGRRKHEWHEREVVSSIPLPRVPTWKPSRSWHSLANATALLCTVSKRGPCSRTHPLTGKAV